MRKKHISLKQVVLPWALSSALILTLTSMFSVFGVFEMPVSEQSSFGLSASIYCIGVLSFNMLMHLLYHFGGFTCSPIRKGIGLGALFGFLFFTALMLFSNVYDATGDSIAVLASGLTARMIEFLVSGMVTAVLCVSHVHRWSLFRLG